MISIQQLFKPASVRLLCLITAAVACSIFSSALFADNNKLAKPSIILIMDDMGNNLELGRQAGLDRFGLGRCGHGGARGSPRTGA